MESKPLDHFPEGKPRGKPFPNQLMAELYAFITEQENRQDFPLVFYWAVVYEFRDRTHSTRRIRKYLDRMVKEGMIYTNTVWESNPLISTKPFPPRENRETKATPWNTNT